MRFSKKIQICKGLSLNLSKSGASLTAGRKGASINIGTSGTFINAGIPGTGIATRKKVGVAEKRTSEYKKGTGRNLVTANLIIALDEAGKPVIKDNDGNIIYDENLLKQITRQDNYKNTLRNLIISRKEEIETANCAFLDIYKLTPHLNEHSSIESRLSNIQLREYVEASYPEDAPSLEKMNMLNRLRRTCST